MDNIALAIVILAFAGCSAVQQVSTDSTDSKKYATCMSSTSQEPINVRVATCGAPGKFW